MESEFIDHKNKYKVSGAGGSLPIDAVMRPTEKDVCMFDTDEQIRKVARSLTHYIYRNTALENYHSDGVKMDGGFYKKIYGIVYRKINKVKLLHGYAAEYPGKCESKADFDKLIASVPEDLQLKFINYLQELVWGFDFGTQWDKAVAAPPIADGQGAASYVLCGRFKECCENGCELDDKTMCYINKDVHNRIYTLLIGGHFNKVK